MKGGLEWKPIDSEKLLKDAAEEHHGMHPIWISIFGILVKLVQVFLFVTEIGQRHGLT